MFEYGACVGLDVHKDTIAIAVARPDWGKPEYRGTLPNCRKSLNNSSTAFSRRRARYLASPMRPDRAATASTGRLPIPATTAKSWRRP